MQQQLKWFLITGLALFASLGFAEDPINQTLFGVAIKGYDPVAYFTASTPTKGNKKFTHKWQDAEWRFASAANRDAFAAVPEKYAPQYGGYCAWAVSQGGTAGIDPSAWKLVDGKLYLNYSHKIQKKWEADMAALILKANANWPGVLE